MKKIYFKFFIYLLSRRRNFIPILSIYFLSLPNTLANQIGIFNWLWFLASFLLEIPSWYFADNFWHRKTLILWKIFQTISVLLFIIWGFILPDYTIIIFSLWAIFQAMWFSLFSWTTAAYFHEILKEQWEDKNYSKIMWKLRWKVSLFSFPIIILLPFFTEIHIVLPFVIWFFIDVIWLIAILLMPRSINNLKIKEKKSLFELLSGLKNTKVLGMSIWLWMITWFFIWASTFRWVYLESLWYPIAFIWLIMWLSRLVRFIVWHYSYLIEKHLSIKQYFLIEVFMFPLSLLAVAYFSNPYLVWWIFSIFVWYLWGRRSVTESYIIKNINPNYKSTMLSVEAQINSIASIWVSFWISFVMGYSYKLWLSSLWVILFFILLVNYYFTFIRQK